MEIALTGAWQKAPYTKGTIQAKGYLPLYIQISAAEPTEKGLELGDKDRYPFECGAGEFLWFRGKGESCIVVNFKLPESIGGGSGGTLDFATDLEIKNLS